MSARSPVQLDWPLSRLWIVIALVCTLLTAPLVLQRVTASATGPGIAVIGDSISARYNDEPGDAKQGWWSVVGRHYKIGVENFSQSGSGFARPGLRCSGNRFGNRLAAIAKTAQSTAS